MTTWRLVLFALTILGSVIVERYLYYSQPKGEYWFALTKRQRRAIASPFTKNWVSLVPEDMHAEVLQHRHRMSIAVMFRVGFCTFWIGLYLLKRFSIITW